MTPASRNPFVLGVNYPWLNYGQDFGLAYSVHLGISRPEKQKIVEADFARIRESGARVVRWFLFGDGRGGFICENGIPRKPDGMLLQDVAGALHLAERYGLKLCFSLIDFLWLQEHNGRRPAHPQEHVLHFAAGREAFLQHVLVPLFREFPGHPALFAWEIANEPEWAIREFHPGPSAKMQFADFRAYAREIARAVHEHGGVPVTLGSARLMWVRAWAGLDLDFYQAHYYPAAEPDARGGLADELDRLPHLDQPLWLGELPARDPRTKDFLREALDTCRKAGLSGAAIWRWTEPEPGGTDAALGRVDPGELQEFRARFEEDAQSV